MGTVADRLLWFARKANTAAQDLSDLEQMQFPALTRFRPIGRKGGMPGCRLSIPNPKWLAHASYNGGQDRECVSEVPCGCSSFATRRMILPVCSSPVARHFFLDIFRPPRSCHWLAHIRVVFATNKYPPPTPTFSQSLSSLLTFILLLSIPLLLSLL